MNKFYLLHKDPDGCGIPLLIVFTATRPKPKDLWEITHLRHLDETPLVSGTLLGPCQFCLAPFSLHADYLISEQEYFQSQKIFQQQYPGYKTFTHIPSLSGKYTGDGNRTRLLQLDRECSVIKIKQIWPRKWEGHNVTIFRFPFPIQQIPLSLTENSPECDYRFVGF